MTNPRGRPTASLRNAAWFVPCLAACLWATGCERPVEPGSDLPADAQPAALGPNIDTGGRGDVSAAEGTDVSGQFQLEADVTSDVSPQSIPLTFDADLEQMGRLSDGSATVSVTLTPSDGDTSTSASTDRPAEVSEQGAFEATITGYTVPASSSEMLASDTDADVTLDAQIVDSDCFRGDIEVVMKNVESPRVPQPIPELTLTGPFTAERNDGACDAKKSPDAGTPSNDTGAPVDDAGRDAS